MLAATHHSTKTYQPGKDTGHRHMADLKSSAAIREDRELRHERWIAIGVLALFVVTIAALLAIAVIGGAAINTGTAGYEYWMMP